MILYMFIILMLLSLVSIVAAYRGRYPEKQIKWLFAVLVLALAGIGARIEPKLTYDLYRHYQIIDRVRGSSYSLIDFLKEGYVITDINYKYTYIYNIFVFIIAKFFPNQALPFFTICITYGSFGYILFREFRNKNVTNILFWEFRGKDLTNRNLVISISIFSVLMPYLYVYSNVRNALAGAIVAFGIYRLYKDRKILLFIDCTVIAVLIHPIAAAIVPFILLSRIKPGVKGIIVTLALPSLVFPLMEYFRLHLGNDYLFRIAAKYYNYTLVRQDNQGRVFLYSTVIMLIALSILALWANRGNKTTWREKKYPLLNLIIWYSMFSLGYFRNYEMMTRLPYSIAFLSPVLVATLFNPSEMKTKGAKLAYSGTACVVFFLALLGFYENIAWLI